MNSLKLLFSLLIATFFTSVAQSQVVQNTYTWGNFDHSAWKIQPNSPTGYVLAGNKFFEPANTDIYMTGIGEFGEVLWNRTHATGFTQVQTMWKSFTRSGSIVRYFVVVAGTQGGSNRAFAMLTNATGHKMWERVSNLPDNIQFGGVTPATNGGWMATGSNGNGQLVAVKFDSYGNLQWVSTLPVSGFGWCIVAANGGGYLIGSTDHTATRIDINGNLVWSTSVNLGASPDGSAYTYSEFEEIVDLPEGQGFVLTGSTFSNSHSAAYSARISYAGTVAWSKVHDPQNTAQAGTPVSWINNAVIAGSEIITSWRRGPVSTGGDIRFQKMNFAGTNIGGVTNFGNTIPTQEAFMTRAHGKYVVGGTRGSYLAAASWIREMLPLTNGNTEDRNEPLAEPIFPGHREQISIYNSQPEFVVHPASRVFANEMRVFPNPGTGLFNVGGKHEAGAMLRVTDMTGRVILEKQIPEGGELLQFDLTGETAGLYNVTIIGAKQVVTRRIVLQ